MRQGMHDRAHGSRTDGEAGLAGPGSFRSDCGLIGRDGTPPATASELRAFDNSLVETDLLERPKRALRGPDDGNANSQAEE